MAGARRSHGAISASAASSNPFTAPNSANGAGSATPQRQVYAPVARRRRGRKHSAALNLGRLLTRDEILDQLWGADYVAESNVVDRHVRNLRIKLQNGWRHPRYIATIPGRGYRFVPTAVEDPA